jgi:hypothetical protein
MNPHESIEQRLRRMESRLQAAGRVQRMAQEILRPRLCCNNPTG